MVFSNHKVALPFSYNITKANALTKIAKLVAEEQSTRSTPPIIPHVGFLPSYLNPTKNFTNEVPIQKCKKCNEEIEHIKSDLAV